MTPPPAGMRPLTCGAVALPVRVVVASVAKKRRTSRSLDADRSSFSAKLSSLTGTGYRVSSAVRR